MSSNFTKLLIKENIRKISKHKTKKIKFNNCKKNIDVKNIDEKLNKKTWIMSKEKRLDNKNTWIS